MAEVTVTFNEALAAAVSALVAQGASPAHASASGRAVVTAEAEGNRRVGLTHVFTYAEALTAGRAKGHAVPLVEEVSENLTRVDAAEGLPHLGVEQAWPRLVAGAERTGVAILALHSGYPCGSLGYFARQLAEAEGLVALVAANAGPAVMAVSGGSRPVFCTNPLAFALPRGPGEAALVIDQSTSAASLVAVRAAAEEGRQLPEGWALDAAGRPTTDPEAALGGSLLPFGGARGANIALMVEMLAAGLTGAKWSREAAPFNSGSTSPGAGLFILAINARMTGPWGSAEANFEGPDFLAHLRPWFDAVLAEEGAHLPGLAKGEALKVARRRGFTVDAEVWARVKALA